MANEISINVTMSCRNGSLIHQVAPGTVQVNQTTKKVLDNTQTIGTTAENIYTGDLTAPGYMHVTNLSATNYIEIGRDNGGTFVATGKVQPGKTGGPIEFPDSATLQARANTAACDVRFIIYDR